MVKSKKKREKIRPGIPQRTFQVLNTLLILLIAGFYIYRAVDYHDQFIALYSEVTSEEHPVYLSEALISKVIGDNDGVCIRDFGLQNTDVGRFVVFREAHFALKALLEGIERRSGDAQGFQNRHVLHIASLQFSFTPGETSRPPYRRHLRSIPDPR